MMKTRIRLSGIALLLIALLLAALLPYTTEPAQAESTGWTVTDSGSTFTVTRTDTSSAETVLYRTVSLSAIDGQHFTAKSGALTFAAGETSKTVTVTEKTPSADAYKYQTSSSRTYRFEVFGYDGTVLAYKDRSVTNGLTQFSADKVSKSVSNLVTLNSGGNFSSGMSSSKYLDVSYTPPSGQVETSGTLSGYVLIDDSYDYAQKPATVSTSTLISSTGAPTSYLNSLGYKIYATVCFTEKEKDDGYQYVQILAGTASASYDGADPNGAVDDPDKSAYKVCFEFADGSNEEGKAYFPHRGTGSGEFSNSNGVLHQQKYKNDDFNGSGAVVFPINTSNITVRFDAAGNNDDTWGYKDLFVRMALCDTTAPTISGDPVVAPGPYGYGSTLYISVPFSEAVNAGSSTTLKTDWGEFAYVSGNGSNVLTFSGVISATFGSNLTVRQINGTVTDLAGNALSDISCYKNFSSVTVELPWSGAGTETDPYIITTTAQLDYMAVRVNANYGSDNFSGKYFELGADLTYAYTTDWDDFTPGTSNMENNYTPVGCWGRSFQGHFDGKGHTVSGIRVFKPHSGVTDHSNESIGLFGFVSGGTIQNIVLRDCNFRGLKNIGGVVGYLSGGSVTNCTVYHVLVGSHAKFGGDLAGGLEIVAGYAGGTITNCWYRDCIRGLTYQGQGEITIMPHPERADNVYTLDTATGVTAAYVDGGSVTIDGETYYAEGSTFTLGYTGTIPTASVQNGYTYTYTIDDGRHTVTYNDHLDGDTLTLPAADTTVSVKWASAWEGSGTEEAPWIITTTDQLDLLRKMVNGQGGYGYNDFDGKYFLLGNDIVYNHTTDWNDADSTESNFTAIGGWRSGSTYNYFNGSFDGDGHTVSGIRIHKGGSGDANSYQGLFGCIGTSGVVQNVTLADAHITGHLNVGGVAGVNKGTVSGCTVSANVLVDTKSGGDQHGGVVGKNSDGTITGCTVSATVSATSTGSDYYGAVAGANGIGSTISNCLAIGATVPVLSDRYGVIVGENISNGTSSGTGILSANYYMNCTVGDTANATNVGAGSTGAPADREGAKSVHLVQCGDGVTAAGSETVLIDGVTYYAAGSTVTLTYTGTPEPGMEFGEFTVTDANGDPVPLTDSTFTMPAGDVTANAELITEWAWLNRQLAAGGTVTLNKDFTAVSTDGYLLIPAGVTVTLDLNGHTLDRNLSEAVENGYVIKVLGTLTVNDSSASGDGAITGGNCSSNYGGVCVDGTNASFTMTGGSITGNTAKFGSGVSVVNGGRFTLNGGTITNNTATNSSSGSGVTVYKGCTFLMTGGSVTGNVGSFGVYVNGTGSSFTMTGGTISNHTDSGVRMTDGAFTMTGGSITGNSSAYNGGGVYVGGGTFTVTGGTISGNACGTGNSSGGGVYVIGGTFSVSGSAVITGNTKGANGPANNVYLYTGKVVTVTDTLTDAASVGVTMQTPGVFTSGLSGNGTAANFTSDNDAYGVYPIGTEAAVGTLYAVHIADGIEGGTVAANPSSAGAGQTVTLAITPGDGCVLTSLTVTDADGNDVSLNTQTFTMPASDVTVNATFAMTWASLSGALQNGGGFYKLSNDVVAGATDTYLTVPSGKIATLDLNGHTLDRNLSEAVETGYVIKVVGDLTITDTSASGTGKITGGNCSGICGGVYVRGGTFTMSGGEISNNTASNSAGGVFIGGTGATFTMSGGEISNNTASYGGGVYVNLGTFTMTGGTISNNTASFGGGVYNGGTFRVSGSPIVTGNKNKKNVYLYNGSTITVTGVLSDTARIGVSMQTPGVFTSGLSGNGTAANFTSDKTSYAVGLNADGEALLGTPYSVTVTPTTGGAVTAPETAVAGATVTLTVAPDLGYELETLTVLDANGDPVELTDNTFVMPASNVTVTATFRRAIADGFYLIGPDWTVDAIDAADKFEENPNAAGEYMLNTKLRVGDQIKVVKVENGAIAAWYPDGLDNQYTVDAPHAGDVTVYFRETYNNAWSDFGGYMWIEQKPLVTLENVRYAYSLTLGDSILINERVFFPENTAYDVSKFAVAVDFGGTVQTIPLTESLRDNDVTISGVKNHVYKFVAADCVAKQVTDDAVITFLYDGNPVANDQGTLRSYTVSVRSYCEDNLKENSTASAKLKALCGAVLSYGAAAQTRFSYKTDDLANATYRVDDPSTAILASYQKQIATGSCSAVQGAAISLVLESRTQINFYIMPASGYTADDIMDLITVKLGDAVVTNYTKTKVTSGNMNGAVLVSVTGIAAKNLDDVYAVSVGNDTYGTRTWYQSPLNYAYDAQSNATEGALVLALYDYFVAAKAYMTNN